MNVSISSGARACLLSIYVLIIAAFGLGAPSTVSAANQATPASDEAIKWLYRSHDATPQDFLLRFRGCTSSNDASSCGLTITNRGAVAMRFALDNETTYAVDREGKVYRVKATIVGSDRRDGGSGDLWIETEPALPTAFTLIFNGATPHPGELRMVLSAGDRGSALPIGGSPPPAGAPLVPVTASTTVGGIRIDFTGCKRTPIRADCAVRVTNLQPQPQAVTVPYNFSDEFGPGSYTGEDSVRLPLRNVRLGAYDNSPPPQYLRLAQGIPVLTSFSVEGLGAESKRGSLEVSLSVVGSANVKAQFSDVSVAAPTATTATTAIGVSVRQGTWLFAVRECVQEKTVLACLGSVTNGSTEPKIVTMSRVQSYIALPDGERLAPKLVTLDGVEPSASLRRDGDAPMRLIFTRAPSSSTPVNIVLSSSVENGKTAVFRDIPIRPGPVMPLFLGDAQKTTDTRIKAAVPDARSAQLLNVLQSGTQSPLEREAAAERLWSVYRNNTAKAFLIRSYREFLRGQIAAATGPKTSISLTCAGFDSLSRQAPCGRMLLMAPHLISLGDRALYLDAVQLLVSGRIFAELSDKVIEGLRGAPPEWRSELFALFEQEATLGARMESEGWKRSDIDDRYSTALQLMMGLRPAR